MGNAEELQPPNKMVMGPQDNEPPQGMSDSNESSAETAALTPRANRKATANLPNPRPYATKTIATVAYLKEKYRKQAKTKAAAKRRRRGW